LLKTKGTLSHFMFDDLFFNKIREGIFGHTKIAFMTTASAPIRPEVINFLKIVFGCPIIEGYGMTESGGCMGDPKDIEVGHCGVPLVNTEIKIVDVPELNYFTTDKNADGVLTPRGEVWTRGQNFVAYLNREKETKEMIDAEGWLHTGDIGVIIPGNKLRIIDRRKNIFKMSQGEYIAPEKIEGVIKFCPHIFQNFVHGKGTESYVVALIVMEEAVIVKMAEENKIVFSDKNELLKNEVIKEQLLDEITKGCKKAQCASYEIPKKLLLTFDQFTVDNGMITVTMKTMRTNIRKVWEEKLNELY